MAHNKDIAARVEKLERSHDRAASVIEILVEDTDDPLAGVSVPVSTGANPSPGEPSHLQQVHADLASHLPVPDGKGGTHHRMPELKASADYDADIRSRTEAWQASRPKTFPSRAWGFFEARSLIG
jgi:hypothetical protein